jgi:hypothetical protein
MPPLAWCHAADGMVPIPREPDIAGHLDPIADGTTTSANRNILAAQTLPVPIAGAGKTCTAPQQKQRLDTARQRYRRSLFTRIIDHHYLRLRFLQSVYSSSITFACPARTPLVRIFWAAND